MMNISMFTVLPTGFMGIISTNITNFFFAWFLALDWVCFNFAIDPVNVMGHTGVDPRLILLPTPVTPADHAHQSHLAIVSTDKWPTRVSLWVMSMKQNEERNKNNKMSFARKFKGCFLFLIQTHYIPFCPSLLTFYSILCSILYGNLINKLRLHRNEVRNCKK